MRILHTVCSVYVKLHKPPQKYFPLYLSDIFRLDHLNSRLTACDGDIVGQCRTNKVENVKAEALTASE